MKILFSENLVFSHPKYGKKTFQKNTILSCTDLIQKLGEISRFDFSYWTESNWKNAVNYQRLYLIGKRDSGKFNDWKIIEPAALVPDYSAGKFLNYQKTGLDQVLAEQDFVLFNIKFPKMEPLTVYKGQYKKKGLRGLIVDALEKLPKNYNYENLTYNQQRNFTNHFSKLLKDQNVSYLGWKKKLLKDYLKTDVYIEEPKAEISISEKEWATILDSSDIKKFLNQIDTILKPFSTLYHDASDNVLTWNEFLQKYS